MTATHASRNTTTGLKFEEKAKVECKGINLKQTRLYKYLSEQGVNWEDYLSRQIRPDECYLIPEENKVVIYEKKFQQTAGSADEKPQTCAFKIYEFKKLFSSLGITDVSYIYIFSDWFKQPKYKDMLDYIRSVDGCDYFFFEEE